MVIAKQREPVCVVCGERRSESAHHGYRKGQGGDDVPADLFGVCGDGTRLCHGMLESRDPDALRKLGEHVVRCRQDFIEYLIGKVGTRRAADVWMRRHMLVELP